MTDTVVLPKTEVKIFDNAPQLKHVIYGYTTIYRVYPPDIYGEENEVTVAHQYKTAAIQ